MSSLLSAANLNDAAVRAADGHLVLALCAEWCGTCRSFRPVLEQLAARYPQVAFAWVDIEDEADLAGDLEVETFPTLAIFRGEEPFYFGATLPMEDVVSGLIRAATEAPRPLSQIPQEVHAFGEQLFGQGTGGG